MIIQENSELFQGLNFFFSVMFQIEHGMHLE